MAPSESKNENLKLPENVHSMHTTIAERKSGKCKEQHIRSSPIVPILLLVNKPLTRL
jgi:hypothetical protein